MDCFIGVFGFFRLFLWVFRLSFRVFLINSFKGVFGWFLGFLDYFYRCFSLQESVLGCFYLCVRVHFSLALSVLYGLDCFFSGFKYFSKAAL